MRKIILIQFLFLVSCLTGNYLMAQENDDDFYIVTLQLNEVNLVKNRSWFALRDVEIISQTDSTAIVNFRNRENYWSYIRHQIDFRNYHHFLKVPDITELTDPFPRRQVRIANHPYFDIYSNASRGRTRTPKDIPKRENASDLGLGVVASYRMQWYDNELMWHFKRVATFSLDLELLIGDWTVTGNMAWGGGYLYDSLSALGWDWQPYTKVSTSTKGIFLSRTSVVKSYGKFSPFIGLQSMGIKLKPQFYMITPDGLENIITSPNSYTIGLHYELLSEGGIFSDMLHTESGLRVCYSYTFLGFENIRGYMHQLTIGLALKYRQANVKQ
jgi:hypothetical protein